ncbi:MAG TPA: BTAD domain-containing putative transcriptional regulator, partial [Acidimicrobiales bacterium]
MLEIRLLGEQRIIGGPDRGGRAPSSRSVALLGYLIVHSEVPQARQYLAGIFWPDSSEAQARTNLRRELHNLRALLGDDPSLIVQPTTLNWRDSATCRVDVRVFETQRKAALRARARDDSAGFANHAHAAIAEYRGELMPGIYDDWVLDGREILLRECVDLCDGVIVASRVAGDRSGAIEVARRRVQLKPLEEAGYRVLIELQAESGDRAAAVSTYHRCATVLEQELGVTPDPETSMMVDRLLDRREVPAKPVAPTRDSSPRNGAAAPGLVGRVSEIERVMERWRRAT